MADEMSVSAFKPAVAVPKRFVKQQIPDDILHDAALQGAIDTLPKNYNFEVHKTVWRLRRAGARRVALQLPEGLLMYACVLADILEAHAGVREAVVMGDVTYGACCVDDLSARAAGADFLVHYGHSCLVPVGHTVLPCLYVFVEIEADVGHLVATIERNFARERAIVLAGTVQFLAAIHEARSRLRDSGYPRVHVPQERPLSAGETLGCTAPRVPSEVVGSGQACGEGGASVDPQPPALVFVADGRFHLEAMMIANPSLQAFRYDPYAHTLTEESYDHAGMRAARRAAIEKARGASAWGLVLGTLGRQGNPALAARLEGLLRSGGRDVTRVLMSEVSPAKLELMPDIEAWVQVACPRLSIDWGEEFKGPVLNPFEAAVCLGAAPPWWDDEPCATAVSPEGECQGCQADPACSTVGRAPVALGHYPMDYYSKSGGAWSSTYHRAPT